MKSLFLLFLMALISCSKAIEPELTIRTKIVKTNLTADNYEYLKYNHPDKIGEELNIQFEKNESNKKNYVIMSCSYDINFITDKKDLAFEKRKCDSNYPYYIDFKDNMSENFKLVVLKNKNSKTNEFKIGFKVITVPVGYDLIDFYNDKFENKNYKIIWSEPIKFK